MSEADWSNRFEQLLALNLIELDDEYYQDELYFKNPSGLNQIFIDLEERNLSNINKLQDVEQQLEVMEDRRVDIMWRLESEKNKQEESQSKVQKSLREAKGNLDNLQKNNSGAQVMERPTVTPNGSSKPGVSKPVDFNKLVDELHMGMCKIWQNLEAKKILKKEGDIVNKDPIDILTVSAASC